MPSKRAIANGCTAPCHENNVGSGGCSVGLCNGRRLIRRTGKKHARVCKRRRLLAALSRLRIRESSGASRSDGTAPISSFWDAPFRKALLSDLAARYPNPTPIQAASWPIALAGQDLIAVAKTGSGKTLGFLLPAYHLYGEGRGGSCAGGEVRVVVLAPTRELAVQISGECDKFGALAAPGCKSLCVYGGVPILEQIEALRQPSKPAVLIATPGRLCDLLKRGSVDLGSVQCVVLDEADRMLDLGFEPEISQIFNATPARGRQTLCFTATWPKVVRELAAKYVRSEASGQLKQVFVEANAGEDLELVANKAVSQTFLQVRDDDKINALWELLDARRGQDGSLKDGLKAVVFANTKRRVNACERTFYEFGATAIHGDRKQWEREEALADFIENRKPILFATDVAARGLDIRGVTHVINFDMARDVESYVHRIGRTGRAGELGDAITFFNPDFDKECGPALCKIARKAGQSVPDWLTKYEGAWASKLWAVEDVEKALAACK